MTWTARKIASKSSMTVGTGKRAYYAQREMTLAEAYDHAFAVMVENMLARDAEEGIGDRETRAPMAGRMIRGRPTPETPIWIAILRTFSA